MSTEPFNADVNAVLLRLFVYPVKSCAGIEVQEAILTETGLEFDRAWMVVDERGEFLTQREFPRMALIRPQLKHYEMVLRAPGMLALHIKLNEVEAPMQVRIWEEDMTAYDMGAVAAQWFTDFLGVKARLVRFDPEHKRISNRTWTGDAEALNQFNDGFPILVISQASLDQLNDRLAGAGAPPVTMERFRPNIVLGNVGHELSPHDEDRLDMLRVSTGPGSVQLKLVKPCPRCPIPNIDPETGLSSTEVGDALQGYRKDARVNGAITFGMNAIMVDGLEQVFKVGQAVEASYRFG
ncbi:MAG: MOSC N-terminal beta barrel domain-containing protein [Pseudomonadota bacterium]